jgi:hypothetical protein
VKFGLEFVPKEGELLDGEGVDHILGNTPDNLDGPLRVNDVQLIEAALEEILQRLRHLLYQSLGDLSDAYTLHVDDGHPVLDTTWYQSARYYKLDHESRHVD